MFWFSDPTILFRPDTWYAFVPTAGMTVDESLNAVVRFTVYLSILLFFCSMQVRYFVYVPVVMAITVALHQLYPNAKKITEPFRMGTAVSSYSGDETSKPTQENPFMNPTLVDINENPNRKPASDPTDVNVRDQINKQFAQTSNLYMDTTDVFQMVQSQRNFYTVPEDDHEGLLAFLGKGAASGKLLNEGYVLTKGSMPKTPASSVERPTGAMPGETVSNPEFPTDLSR
jgi:Family of unknown function (DUF5762)|uniref:Minor capsid protein P9 transmembrane helices domain-containing protein n=1 Tax=viral metagenome TaxID=1070528 RepID=A0A6C0ELJ4_9ZZZZ